MIKFGLFFVSIYYTIASSVFLNVAFEDAGFLERTGDFFLAPTQYVLVGQTAKKLPDGTYELSNRFDYSKGFWWKTTAATIALPFSWTLGSTIKRIGRVKREFTQAVHPNTEKYKALGFDLTRPQDLFPSQGHARRPGDEMTMQADKLALEEIGKILSENHIPWWLDCGSCLGAYRYGGVIPWDWDLDLAVLIDDFDNVKAALQKLDPEKYQVQDWSTRDLPKSFFKVFVKETKSLIDIYCFKILPETKELQYVFTLNTHTFFPEWFKIRERRYTAPTAISNVFPLKKMLFDGVEVFVPNEIEKYLQRYYGKNLAPAKVYDPVTCQYEKDLSHPYWKNAYVH